MQLRFVGNDRVLRGELAIDCLRFHCQGDHSPEGQRGDVDGVMRRVALAFELEASFALLPTVEERAAAFVAIAREHGVLIAVDGESGKLKAGAVFTAEPDPSYVGGHRWRVTCSDSDWRHGRPLADLSEAEAQAIAAALHSTHRSRCRRVWHAGILSPPGSPRDGTRCTLPPEHSGDHDFRDPGELDRGVAR